MFFVDKMNKNSKNPVLQLIKSERINGQSRQVIVISLGADYTIPTELRKDVAQAVTEKLKGMACWLPNLRYMPIAIKVVVPILFKLLRPN